MPRANGLHHLAVSTGDMKSQIEFFTDVLGMELVALYWMHGVDGAWHGFLRLNETAAIAFVFSDQIKETEPVKNVSYAGNPAEPSAPGTMQHLALNVDSMADLLNMRDRIRSRGIPVFGPIHHGFCSSIYFAGPENLALEIATSGGVEHPLSAETWIDKEVQALAGISDEELQRFTNPAPYEGDDGALPQPEYDPSKPHQEYPDGVYEMMLQTPDDVLTEQASEPTPPN
ncbi:MAG: VOC family protein [Hyphomonadaceae bacterium]|nr:VOC family protein [Hyphomonadaceae bacterium]